MDFTNRQIVLRKPVPATPVVRGVTATTHAPTPTPQSNLTPTTHRRNSLANLRALTNANAQPNPLRVERLTRAKSAYWSLAKMSAEGEKGTGTTSSNTDTQLGQRHATEDASSELSAVVDDLLNGLSAKFASVSAEIFAKIDDMSRRLDSLEATIQANNEPPSKQ